jgi:HlyD family secretion protein
VIVRIDPTEVEAEVQQSRAALAEAQYRLAQAQLTENPTNVSINSQIRQQTAGVASASADYDQVQQNLESQVAAANENVIDATGKVDGATAALTSAKANLENARAKYNRTVELYKQGYVAAQEVDDSKTTVSVQEAAVEQAAAQLSSAQALKRAAEKQASIVKTKGRADIAASQAKLQQARASLESANANTAQGPAYQQSISALRSVVAAAQASLQSARARRADTVLISPLDGFVTGRYLDPGAIATPGQAIIAVQFMKQVWVSVSAPEELSTKIHIGQPATIRTDAIPGRTFTGNVIQVNPSADPQSRQFVVRVIMSNTEGLFKPGTFARVSIETDRVSGITAVPREAVKSDRTGDYVMVVDADNKAERRPVTTGTEDTDYVAITDGLAPGERVVTMSAMPLREGQAVGTGKGRHGGNSRPEAYK